MSASVGDQENMSRQEHKSIQKENMFNKGLLLETKGQGWILVAEILMVMESKGIFTEALLLSGTVISALI